MVRALISRKGILFLLIFLLYLSSRIGFSLSAIYEPREWPDTVAYLRISRQPLLSEDFWGSSRPFGFPLLLKIVGQNLQLAAAAQLVVSVFSWGVLALLISSFIRTDSFSYFAFIWILLISLIPRLSGWDFTMLSESLSISWFVLLIGCSMWLIKGWHWGKVFLLGLSAIFWAFIRDTNAYLLLITAFLLLVAVVLGWARSRILVIITVFMSIFVINNASADLGKRWVFPLINVIGRRVLLDPSELHFLESSCGMPVSPALMAMRNEFANGQDRAFYIDPELEGFRIWLLSEGKSCYSKMLMSTPIHSIGEPLVEFNGLIYFRKLRSFLAQAYDPLIPFAFEVVFYPVQNALWVWILLTAAAISVIFLQLWKSEALWSVFVLLSLTIFPHLFITWHGDAMDPERHAISVGLQITLSSWIFMLLLLDRILVPSKKS
jgi:hypothetical protein